MPLIAIALQGNGTIYQDFTWASPSTSSPGAISGGQMFQPSANAAIVTTRPTELITTAGIYQVAIIFGNDDSQSASCSVAVMASGPPTSISETQGPTTDLNTLTSPLEGGRTGTAWNV